MNNNPAVGKAQIDDFLQRAQRGNYPTLRHFADAVEHLNLLGTDVQRPSPPDMGGAHGDLIRLWVGLKVLVEREAYEICTDRNHEGRPVTNGAREALALHQYTMAVQRRLNQIARKEGHSTSVVEQVQIMVRQWHIDQCEAYIAEYGLDEDLEPPDERTNQAMGVAATHCGPGQGRHSRLSR